jgi:hypothetical protein
MLKEHIAMVGAWVFSIDLLTHYISRLPMVTEIFFALPLSSNNNTSWKI